MEKNGLEMRDVADMVDSLRTIADDLDRA
jgi:hypothetical protein